jgi:sorbitol-specific phosphotransferase system component IIBC
MGYNGNAMEENNMTTEQPTAQSSQNKSQVSSDDRKKIFGLVAAVVVVLAIVVGAAIFLFSQRAEETARIRDVFIIFMALESIIIGAALVILIVQLATLINLLQNEIKPILNSTNETVNTVRGTVTFLSDNLAEPVIKLNEYLAVIKRLTELLRIGRK